MARIKGTLKHGLRLGKDQLKDFEIHSHLTAGMILSAKEQAEKVVPFEHAGKVVPVVVESPARLGALMLCQQIGRIGVLAGPLDIALFETLHEEDMAILNLYADLAAGAVSAQQLSEKLSEIGASAAPEMTDRGRDLGPGGGAGEGGDALDPPGHAD